MIGADVSETMGEGIWFACYRGQDGIVAWLLESTMTAKPTLTLVEQ